MTFLILSYLYSPAISPRALRWTAIADHWISQGHQVDVVCGWPASTAHEHVFRGVRVHAATGRLDVLRRTLREQRLISGLYDEIQPGSSKQRVSSPAYLSAMWVSSIWRKLYWPDYACLWLWSATEKCRELLRIRAYDGIVSVSVPFTSHLVGYRLKAIRRNAHWIMDVGDPFSFDDGVPQNNLKLYRRLNRLVERKLFKAADAVAVTTELTRERYADLFPESAHKVRVIPPTCTVEISQHRSMQSVFPANDKIRLVFVGTLYREIRSPAFLLELFVQMLQTDLAERIELHFFGDVSDCADILLQYRSLLGSKIFLHGVVEHDRAVQAMSEAQILVNIGNATAYQLPSKIVEYVSLGKPILNLATVALDSSTDFLKQYPASLSLVRGQVGSRKIQDLARFVESPPRVESTDLQAWLSGFKVEKVAAAYHTLLVR